MPDYNSNKGIITLAFLMIAGLFILGLTLIMTTGTVVELKKNVNTKSGSQSFYTAEAAAREGIYQYVKNGTEFNNVEFPLETNDIPPESILLSVGPSLRGWAYREATGTAENNLTNRGVKNTLLLYAGGEAFDYAVYVNGGLTLKGGNQNEIMGDVFANGNIICNGQPVSVGDFYSFGSVDPNCNDPDNIFQNIEEPIQPPTIETDFYYDIATAAGTVFTPSQFETYLNDNGNTVTGVMYLIDTNNAVINGVDLLTGSLVAEGSIKINGGTYSATGDYADYAAIIVKNGNLEIGGNTNIEGLVYVEGKIKFTGGGGKQININGSIIATQSIIDETTIGGSVKIEYEPLSGPPGGIVESEIPEIISWNEQ